MLTSATLLHFGHFTTALCCSPLQLRDTRSVQALGKVPASLLTTGASAGPIWGYLSWGTPQRHHDPTSSIKHQQKTGKSCFWNPRLPFPPAAFPTPAIPGIRGTAGAAPSHDWEQELPPEHWPHTSTSGTTAHGSLCPPSHLQKRKPNNCRKYIFIPHNQRIREWDEEQQMQPCQVAGLAVPSPDPDFKHQGNHHWAKHSRKKLLFIPEKRWNCNAEETCSVLTQWSSREPAEHNTDSSGKTSLQRKKTFSFPSGKLHPMLALASWQASTQNRRAHSFLQRGDKKEPGQSLLGRTPRCN